MDINAEHSMQHWEIYLDNGATTAVDPRVAAAALSAMTEAWGNPSSSHRLGAAAARLLTHARAQVAAALGADAGEITFTSGGTEANALALQGATARAKHVVVSGFEHPSVADAARALAERGVEVTTVAPSPGGVVAPEAFAQAVRAETALVACLWVQNEIGTVQPVDAIARAVKARAPRCHVHVDAVQALGKLPIDLAASAFDSLALSAHKIHGPKGAGALWLRKSARLRPLVYGGGQERGLRPGTEGMPGIVALGLAVELAAQARAEAAPRMARLRDQLWEAIAQALPTVMRHGDPALAAPHVLSIGFPHLLAEPLLHALEAKGVYVSAGSACHAKERKPSTTLRAIGVPDHVATLRLSLSRLTRDDEIARAAEAVVAAVKELS
jgi:cysteine desulfurase